MALDPKFLDELRARVSLADLIGRRVKLTRKGREWSGLCPFHNEKTPSFYVNEDKGFYHCFGCGAHGDAIGFLRETDGLGFMDAVKALADEAGMTMPQPSPDAAQREERRRTLHDLVEHATRFFEARLAGPEGAEARAYLESRGLDTATIGAFRLGHAPADRGLLIGHLEQAGFSIDQMVAVGLARLPEGGGRAYAFFRDRILFPVADRRGRIVAFGGRRLAGDGPKYINTGETEIFHKGSLLYGADRAAGAVRQGHTPIAAEGYMDVIALVRAGFRAAVAPLGTALTETQIAELWRLGRVPVLCFDGDAAGRRAAWRAVERILPKLRPDHSVRVAFLPQGEDPDSLIQAGGTAAMRAVLEAATPLAQVVFEHACASHALDTPEGRAGLRAGLMAFAEGIEDRGVRAAYRDDLLARHDRAMAAIRGPTSRGRSKRGAGTGSGRDPRGTDRTRRYDRGATPGPRPSLPGGRGAGPTEQEVLLSTLLHHPVFVAPLLEVVDALPMPSAALEGFRDDLLSSDAARTLGGADQAIPEGPDPGLDKRWLSDHLKQLGWSAVVNRLSSESLLRRAPFARPGTEETRVEACLSHLLDGLTAAALVDEVKRARDQYVRTPTPENEARVLALLRDTVPERV